MFFIVNKNCIIIIENCSCFFEGNAVLFDIGKIFISIPFKILPMQFVFFVYRINCCTYPFVKALVPAGRCIKKEVRLSFAAHSLAGEQKRSPIYGEAFCRSLKRTLHSHRRQQPVTGNQRTLVGEAASFRVNSTHRKTGDYHVVLPLLLEITIL